MFHVEIPTVQMQFVGLNPLFDPLKAKQILKRDADRRLLASTRGRLVRFALARRELGARLGGNRHPRRNKLAQAVGTLEATQ